jgi:hypothetical protein
VNWFCERLGLALGEWARPYDPSRFGLSAREVELLNDDRIGRGLDRLFDADRASLGTEVVLRAVRAFDVDCTQLHTDSTTVTSSGAQPNVTIQIVPFATGQYEALRMGSISVMKHRWDQVVSVYYLPYRDLALIDDLDEAANFIAALDQAATVALSPNDSLAFIAQAGEQWRQADG